MWCGIEYQVASHLIYEGLVDEGLAVVRGIRGRYDGVRRNPWNEFECGSHYGRSLASWSVLTALSGFTFDLTRGAIGFAPRLDGPECEVFWSVASGWGTYRQERQGRRLRVQLTLAYGTLALRELGLGAAAFQSSVRVSAAVNGRAVAVGLEPAVKGQIAGFAGTLDPQEGDEPAIEIAS